RPGLCRGGRCLGLDSCPSPWQLRAQCATEAPTPEYLASLPSLSGLQLKKRMNFLRSLRRLRAGRLASECFVSNKCPPSSNFTLDSPPSCEVISRWRSKRITL